MVRGLALQAWAKGSWPCEKVSVRAGVACSVGKVCTNTLQMTVSSTSNVEEKCEWLEKRKHKRSCTELSEFNVTRILGFWPQKKSDETGAPCTYRKVCNWDTVDDSVQSHDTEEKGIKNAQAIAEANSFEFGRHANPWILYNTSTEILTKKEGKVWQAPGVISPTFCDGCPSFRSSGSRNFPTPSYPHLESYPVTFYFFTMTFVRLWQFITKSGILQFIRKFWILDLPGFFTGVLSRAKLLLHLRSFSSFFNFFDLCFLDCIIDVSFNFVKCTSIFTWTVFYLYLNYLMLATSPSSNFTPFKYRAGRIGSCGGFSLRST